MSQKRPRSPSTTEEEASALKKLRGEEEEEEKSNLSWRVQLALGLATPDPTPLRRFATSRLYERKLVGLITAFVAPRVVELMTLHDVGVLDTEMARLQHRVSPAGTDEVLAITTVDVRVYNTRTRAVVVCQLPEPDHKGGKPPHLLCDRRGFVLAQSSDGHSCSVTGDCNRACLALDEMPGNDFAEDVCAKNLGCTGGCNGTAFLRVHDQRTGAKRRIIHRVCMDADLAHDSDEMCVIGACGIVEIYSRPLDALPRQTIEVLQLSRRGSMWSDAGQRIASGHGIIGFIDDGAHARVLLRRLRPTGESLYSEYSAYRQPHGIYGSRFFYAYTVTAHPALACVVFVLETLNVVTLLVVRDAFPLGIDLQFATVDPHPPMKRTRLCCCLDRRGTLYLSDWVGNMMVVEAFLDERGVVQEQYLLL